MSGGGFSGPLYGAVVDVLKAAATAGSIGSGAMALDPLKVFEAAVPQSGGQLPLAVVRLPLQPYDSNKWVASGNFKDSLFKVEVALQCNVTLDGSVAHPYGDGTTPGILTLSDDVMNALETAGSTFKAATAKLIDFSVGAAAMQPDAAGTATTIFTITFQVRYVAGNR